MALNLSLSHQSWASPVDPARCSVTGPRSPWRVLELGGNSKSNANANAIVVGKRRIRVRGKVRASLDTMGAELDAIVGKVTQVNKDTFWPIVKAAADKIVVLDMYTQWCGPCKVIAPKFEKLAEEYTDVVFLKLDCNQENKPLAKELGIRVVPTFKILKDGKIVEEVTGAKFEKLVAAIDAARSN